MQTKIKQKAVFGIAALLAIFIFPLILAQIPLSYEVPLKVSPELPFNYYGEGAKYYFPSFSEEVCESGQDFIIQIPPGACSPAVVRSDLLEEQPVPVFCRLTGMKINPIIEVPHIKRISITQKESHKDILTTIFHPAKAGLKTSFANMVGSPTLMDLGYLVVVLKRRPTEAEMPDMIEVNLTARIEYDTEKTFGIAENQFLLPVLSEKDWENGHLQYGFWQGKGYVRAKDIREDKAKITIYGPDLQPLNNFNLGSGEVSKPSYMSGFYCSAGYKVRLDDVIYPQVRAELYVDGDKLIVTKNMQIKDSKCKVSKILPSPYGLGGSVIISCPGESFTLTKEPVSSAELIINNSAPEKFQIGGGLFDDTYFVYAGNIFMAEDQEALNVVVLAKTAEKEDKVVEKVWGSVKECWESKEFLSEKIIGKKKVKEYLEGCLSGEGEKSVIRKVKRLFNSETELFVIVEGGNVGTTAIKISEIKGLSKAKYPAIVEKYYDEAVDSYQDVVSGYSYLVDESGNISYGIKALWESADKAMGLGKTFDQALFLERLINRYPESGFADEARKKLSGLYSAGDAGKASALITSGGQSYRFELNDIIKPSETEMSVEISLDNKPLETFVLNDMIVEGLYVDSIKEDTVILKNTTGHKITMREGKETIFGKTKIKLYKINLLKFAKVSILPWSREGVTLTNFTFRAGIEKRAIKLSPEQTEKYIEKLDKTIKKWESVHKKFGSLITQWKKTCLIGAGALWVSNFLDTLSGKGIARNMVMRGFDGRPGMIDECGKLVAQDKYKSISQCLLAREKAGEVDAQIGAWEESITACNEKTSAIKKAEGVMVSGEKVLGGLFRTSKRVDNKAYMDEFYGIVKEDLSDDEKKAVKWNIENEKIYRSETKDICSYLELRNKCAEYAPELESLCKNVDDAWDSKIKSYSDMLEAGIEQEKAATLLNDFGLETGFVYNVPLEGEAVPPTEISTLKAGEARELGFETEEKITIGKFRIGEVIYLPVLESEAGEWMVKDVYEAKVGQNKIESVEKIDADAFKEKYKIYRVKGKNVNECRVTKYNGELEIEFWEEWPYKGMPAKMPLVDLKKGYYFATRQYGYGLEAYQESGKVQNFWVCNVGPNEVPNFDFGSGPRGDDCCALVPYGETYSEEMSLLGLTKSDVSKILKCANEAANAYRAGKRKVGTSCCSECIMGKPAVAAPTQKCEDFMSPSSCNLMFNLCDPVVCPASRCDLDGKMPVDDVVQTGIIGGLTLCLHNADEVAVPFCLSGIYAGMENYLTILKSTRACLKEKLETGKSIGICDQLQSVYICEFFWKQLTPFLKVGIPSLVESITHGKKSGGEYLTFSNAWKNAEASAKYITNYYKEDAFRAFQLGSIAEAGSPVCRAFISLRYPSQAALFDELTRPESPYQVNAVFYETPMSTATVPAVSHYKVYYHLYAGEEKGHYFSVYLKQPSQPGYYQTPETYPVPGASGYLNTGQFIDISKDFTAPAGYKELCVKIDAKEHCGFGKATTTLGVEKLMAQYAAKQATEGVTTEKECVSGTPGLIAPNLNPQALVEETLEPAIWRRGIVRVCSTENPGKGTNSGRWTKIGFCENKNVGCWLDGESVKGAIKDLGLEKKTLEDAGKISDDLLSMEGFLSKAASENKLKEIEKDTQDVLARLSLSSEKEIESAIEDLIIRLETLVEKSITEDARVKAQMQIALIYNEITMLLKQSLPGEKYEGEETAAETEPAEKEEQEEPEEPEKTEEKSLEKELFAVMFSYNSYALGEENKMLIENEMKEVLKLSDVAITFEGYACDMGSAAYNLQISKNRANAVHKYISENFKNELSAKKIAVGKAEGKGETYIFSDIKGDALAQLKAEADEAEKTPRGSEERETLKDNPELVKNRRVVIKVEEKAEEKSTAGKEKEQCNLVSAKWLKEDALHGEKAELVVYGENCNGMEVQFVVKEADMPLRFITDRAFADSEDVSKNPAKAVFKGNKATSAWTAEWIKDGWFGDPEYVFGAVVAVGDQLLLSSNLLHVKKYTAIKCELKEAYWADLEGKKINETESGKAVKMIVEGEGCENVPFIFSYFREGLEAPINTFENILFADGKAEKEIARVGAINKRYMFSAKPLTLPGTKGINSGYIEIIVPEW